MKNSNVKKIYPVPNEPSKLSLNLYSNFVQAGFPSPADEHLDKQLDLHELLIQSPASTFYVRVSGDSMINAGIFPNDILIVDKSITAKHNDIVLALVSNEYTIKRLYQRDDLIKLRPENEAYDDIVINDFDELTIWGVATGVVRQLK